MKKPTNDLFRVIQSMTPAEKRYYKMHYASGGSVLTDLFDYLNSREYYDEETAKRHFLEKGAPNFKVYKVQLQQQVLKSLASFHSKRSVMSKIRQGLEEVDILAEKQLHDLAMEQLSKVKKLCEKYEEHTYLIEVARLDYFIGYITMDKPGMSSHPVYEIMEESLGHLERQVKLSRLSNQLMDLIRKKEGEGVSAEKIEALQSLLDSPLLQDSPSDSTLEKLSRNVAKSFIFKLQNKEAQSHKLRRENIELFRKHPHLKESMSFHYLSVLRNYLNHCLSNRDFDEVAQLLKEGKAFAEKHQRTQDHLSYFFYAELEMYYRQCRFGRLLEVAPGVIQHLERNRIEEQRIAFIIYAMIIMAFLATGQHEKTGIYFRKMQAAKGEVRQLFKGLIFLLEWISFFDAGEEHLAENLLQSYRRRNVVKKETVDPFLPGLLCFFKKLLAKPFERRQLAKQFLFYLDQFEHKGLLLIFRHFQVDNWVLALSRGMTIEEACREKRKLQV